VNLATLKKLVNDSSYILQTKLQYNLNASMALPAKKLNWLQIFVVNLEEFVFSLDSGVIFIM
jgi:hypothetical protein